MSQQTITPELRQWIVAQAESGQQPEQVLASMQASGWDEDVALQAMQEVLFGKGGPVARLQARVHKVPELLPVERNRVWAHDREVTVQVQIQHPRVVVFSDLLSLDECAELIELSRPRLSRSETVVHTTGGSEVNSARTSQGMFFGRAENRLCALIEARLSALLQWPVENGEGLQILRYTPGAEYRPHYDYFEPTQAGTPAILKRGGQRVGTVVMYLNTPEAGGATTFPDAGVSVHPIAGSAVFFSYPQPTPETKTLHGGAPVSSGEKWVATKWLREGRFD